MVKINRKLLSETIEFSGMTRRQFARKSKLRPNTISEILNNDARRIRCMTLTKILSALPYGALSASELITRPLRAGGK